MSNENLAQSSNVDQSSNFKLAFLCSLVPKSFDGHRLELHEFLSNCNNANKFADESQKEPLLAFIISRLTGNAKAQLRDKVVDTWEDLQKILLQLYSDKKHYTQLMEELSTIKQFKNESCVNFYNRIENLTTRIFNSLNCKTTTEQKGRTETIAELALQRFIYHSLPEISRFLRGRDFLSISTALTSAIEEERALQMHSSDRFNTQSVRNSKFCTICKKANHTTNQCFRNKPRVIHQVNSSRNTNDTNKTKFYCEYCKKPYHTIDKCFKKQNDERSKNRQVFSRENIHLNSITPQESVVSVEME